jgi:UDP-GlcNAc:undecaprenyl-phosphate/decaprenyl-phosphate GlcNAc-1-phosphate transferase
MSTVALISACAFGAAVAAAAAFALAVNGRRVRRVLDDNLHEPQKIHSGPIPRIGGVAIALGMLSAATLAQSLGLARETLWVLFLCMIPGFAWGLIEDVSKRGAVMARLVLTGMTPTLAYVFLDARITEIGLPGLDGLLAVHAVSFLFTVFAVTGLAHALNVIDGLNGLAGMTGLLASVGLAVVAWLVGDPIVVAGAGMLGAGIVGFMFVNFPSGRIFLGDGGAYLLGLMLAVLGVMLVQRNPEVSVWFPLMLLAYPVFETLFSAYRRRRRGQSPGSADALHLHSLVYRRIVRWAGFGATAPERVSRNSLASSIVWVLPAICMALAVTFWDSTLILEVGAVGFVGLYLIVYASIVRFRVPVRLVLRKPRHAPAKAPSMVLDSDHATEGR